MKQNPFSLYDFLGYLIPGSICLYMMVFSIHHVGGHSNFLADAIKDEGISKLDVYAPFIVSAYVFGHFISFMSSITIERYAIWTLGFPSKYLINLSPPEYFYFDGSSFEKRALRVIVSIFLFPLSIPDFVLNKFFGVRKIFGKRMGILLEQIVRRKSISLIHDVALSGRDEHNTDGKGPDVDFFRYIYHYAVENSPNHLSRMQNYVALYGFMRAISLIFVFVFWIIYFHIFFHSMCSLSDLLYLPVFSFISYVFYLGFVKFHRRFTLEAYMAMIVTYPGDIDRKNE